MGARDLAKASGLPKGTLQRILLTLCELGFVSQDGKGGAYSLTLKFFKLGQRIASNNSLVEKARPACRQLMEKVNETVNLCVAQNFDMVVMAQQVSWQILRLDSIIGSSFPIYPSASGKVHCAFLEESELLKFLNELREARPELTTGRHQPLLCGVGGDTPGRGGLRLRGNLYGGPLCSRPYLRLYR